MRITTHTNNRWTEREGESERRRKVVLCTMRVYFKFVIADWPGKRIGRNSIQFNYFRKTDKHQQVTLLYSAVGGVKVRDTGY